MRLVLYIVTAHIDLTKILGLDFFVVLLFAPLGAAKGQSATNALWKEK